MRIARIDWKSLQIPRKSKLGVGVVLVYEAYQKWFVVSDHDHHLYCIMKLRK